MAEARQTLILGFGSVIGGITMMLALFILWVDHADKNVRLWMRS